MEFYIIREVIKEKKKKLKKIFPNIFYIYPNYSIAVKQMNHIQQFQLKWRPILLQCCDCY